MQIGVDAYEANVMQRVGIGQYAYQLLWAMYKLDKQNQYTLFLPTAPGEDMPKARKNWSYRVGKPGAFWTVRQLPHLVNTANLDVIFSPTHYAPWFTRIPQVVSIMDLSYIHYPQMFQFKDLMQLRYMTAKSIKSAKKILTISQYSKKDIVEHYHYPEKDIVVTYPGINIVSTNETKDSATRTLQNYQLKPGFILYVGTLQPRKNIQRLIQAYSKLETDMPLVLVGKKGWLYQPIFEEIRRYSKNSIRLLDYVTEAELPVLYRNAACLTLVSLYEGFGLPVAEAMYYGCPVVVSQTTSLPEVAGESGIYVDPENVESITRGLDQALHLTAKERLKRIANGKKWVGKFSWEQCARITLDTLKMLYQP